MRAEYHDDWAFPAGGPPTVVVSPSSTRTLAAAHRPRHRTGGPQIELRDGAWVAELTGLLDLSAWPVGTRLILRKERPHPGAQLRITDHDGMRVTGFLTNTTRGQLADLELRHRRHARVENRIRNGKDTGLRNLPFHDMAQNRIWLAIAALAQDLWILFTASGVVVMPPQCADTPPPVTHTAHVAAEECT